jgi:hypothetical protein
MLHSIRPPSIGKAEAAGSSAFGIAAPSMQADREPLASMRAAVELNDSLTLLVGDAAAGNQLIVDTFVHVMREAGHVMIQMIGSPGGDPIAILARALGCARPDGAPQSMLAPIERSLVEHAANGRSVILLIDDAHALSARALAGLDRLSGLEHDGEALVSIVLVGHAGLKALLSNPELPRLNCWRAVRLEQREAPAPLGISVGTDRFEADDSGRSNAGAFADPASGVGLPGCESDAGGANFTAGLERRQHSQSGGLARWSRPTFWLAGGGAALVAIAGIALAAWSDPTRNLHAAARGNAGHSLVPAYLRPHDALALPGKSIATDALPRSPTPASTAAAASAGTLPAWTSPPAAAQRAMPAWDRAANSLPLAPAPSGAPEAASVETLPVSTSPTAEAEQAMPAWNLAANSLPPSPAPSRAPAAAPADTLASVSPAETARRVVVGVVPIGTPSDSAAATASAPPVFASGMYAGMRKARPAPGLLLVLRQGDTLLALYRKVYQGVTPPPFALVQAINRYRSKPGDAVIFPAPPPSWTSQARPQH